MENFLNFSPQNGVLWCILGALFLRFMCPMDCSCMINFIEVPVCVKILRGSSTQDDPCRSNIGGRDPCNPCGVDAYVNLLNV